MYVSSGSLNFLYLLEHMYSETIMTNFLGPDISVCYNQGSLKTGNK